MPRLNHMDQRQRAKSALDHCEFFADECTDAGLSVDAADLRALARAVDARLAAVDAAVDAVAHAYRQHKRAHAALTRENRRCALDIEAHFVVDVAMPLCGAARVGPTALAAHRLAHLTDAQRATLGPVVDDVANALRAVDVSVHAVIAAEGEARRLTAWLEGETQRARAQCERAKARLLARLDVDDDAFRRISRRVVRTRPAAGRLRFDDPSEVRRT